MTKLVSKLIAACLLLAPSYLFNVLLQLKIQSSEPKGLKDYYKDYFYVGTAVSPQGLRREDEAKLIVGQFNSMTPENAMKMGRFIPGRMNMRSGMQIRLLLLQKEMD